MAILLKIFPNQAHWIWENYDIKFIHDLIQNTNEINNMLDENTSNNNTVTKENKDELPPLDLEDPAVQEQIKAIKEKFRR